MLLLNFVSTACRAGQKVEALSNARPDSSIVESFLRANGMQLETKMDRMTINVFDLVVGSNARLPEFQKHFLLRLVVQRL